MLKRLIQMIAERSFQMSDTPSFKLASGKLSKYYVNCRLISLDPEGMHLIGNLIYDRIKDGGIEVIGGPVLGAVPIVDAVAMTAYHQGKFVNVTLSEYLGKWVLLCFYPGDFTFV